MANINATGRKSKDGSILTKLKAMTNQQKAYFLLWKHAPNLLVGEDNIDTRIDTFDDLKKYAQFKSDTYTEEFCNKWLFEPTVQKAQAWLLNIVQHYRLVEIYENYYKIALDDTSALKPFIEISNVLLKNEETNNKVFDILNGVDTADEK